MNKKNNTNTENSKIVVWEGFRKELPWILFWLLIGVMCFGYYQDKKICEEVLSNPCDACYGLNGTLMDSDYLFAQEGISVYINESIISSEDKNPNARTISDYRE